MRTVIRLIGCAILVGLTTIGWSEGPIAQVFPDPLVVACGNEITPPDIIPEIRGAASLAASDEIGGEIKVIFEKFSEEAISRETFDQELVQYIQELERIAQGPNRQCRSVVINEPGNAIYAYLPALYFQHALERAIIAEGDLEDEAVFRTEFLREVKLITDSAAQAKSFEMSLSRALVLIYMPLPLVLDLELPPQIFDELFDVEKWERAACGGVEKFQHLGFEINGALFLMNNDSGGFPFREAAALSWWIAIHVRGLDRDASYREVLSTKAVRGCTHELRSAAARAYLSGVRSVAEINALATQGESPELRAAAASYLVYPLALSKDLSDEDLQRLALTGQSSELRSAAGWALGLRWQQKVNRRQLGLTTAFPFIGPDRKNIQEGNIVQFVAAHTGANPELAQAAILPLFEIFLSSQCGECERSQSLSSTK